MKIKNGFVVREIAGECVVVALGEASKIFNGIIKLNDTGRIIWNMLAEGSEKKKWWKRSCPNMTLTVKR